MRTRELDKMIKADEKRMAKEVKLLLLGTPTRPAADPYSPASPSPANRCN